MSRTWQLAALLGAILVAIVMLLMGEFQQEVTETAPTDAPNASRARAGRAAQRNRRHQHTITPNG